MLKENRRVVTCIMHIILKWRPRNICWILSKSIEYILITKNITSPYTIASVTNIIHTDVMARSNPSPSKPCISKSGQMSRNRVVVVWDAEMKPNIYVCISGKK
eukprot:TRINITY_DN4987_c0_g1_i1.p1 TRINITY_DN4987_c0_g1~~TRINITY_DN4987_c0_g1_i1.p1  ORF type:complete len:103 (-),score=11.56 TRINITY_DN4987_c0_g1_i1:63-371(-)